MAGRKLKVFQARFGFHDSVVAAPSQAAALRAWDTRQNLFASGDATPATDAAAIAAARAHPGVPLRRAVGDDGPFDVAPTRRPRAPEAPAKPPAAPAAKARPPPRPRPPDRARLDAAETALRALDDRERREAADFRREQDDLDARRSAARAALAEARETAQAALADARRAWRADGGGD